VLIEGYEGFGVGEDRLSSVGGVGKVATDEATGFS
jgi:hypothetical protein